ncbi:MAG: hypothetical protein JOZ05_21340 [Acetobacteraceae bacterium]|nr:hypothetical protein [Acetobacteraceae bacterium]
MFYISGIDTATNGWLLPSLFSSSTADPSLEQATVNLFADISVQPQNAAVEPRTRQPIDGQDAAHLQHLDAAGPERRRGLNGRGHRDRD